MRRNTKNINNKIETINKLSQVHTNSNHKRITAVRYVNTYINHTQKLIHYQEHTKINKQNSPIPEQRNDAPEYELDGVHTRHLKRYISRTQEKYIIYIYTFKEKTNTLTNPAERNLDDSYKAENKATRLRIYAQAEGHIANKGIESRKLSNRCKYNYQQYDKLLFIIQVIGCFNNDNLLRKYKFWTSQAYETYKTIWEHGYTLSLVQMAILKYKSKRSRTTTVEIYYLTYYLTSIGTSANAFELNMMDKTNKSLAFCKKTNNINKLTRHHPRWHQGISALGKMSKLTYKRTTRQTS